MDDLEIPEVEVQSKEVPGIVFGELVEPQTADEKQRGVPERKINLTGMGKKTLKVGLEGTQTDIQVPLSHGDSKRKVLAELRGVKTIQKRTGILHTLDRGTPMETRIRIFDPAWQHNAGHPDQAFVWVNGSAITSKFGVVLENEDLITFGPVPTMQGQGNEPGKRMAYFCRAVRTTY